MKKLSEALAEIGIASSFPIEIKDANGNVTYYEDSSGGWYKYERDANDNVTYYEDGNGWYSREYDAKGNVTYLQNHEGYWYKYEYDDDGNSTSYEDSDGYNNRWSREVIDIEEDADG